MAYREFVHGGTQWRAWDTLSSEPESVRPALRAGWITFESQVDGERRRLAPVPPGWERLPATALGELCTTAFHVAPALSTLQARGGKHEGEGKTGRPSGAADGGKAS